MIHLKRKIVGLFIRRKLNKLLNNLGQSSSDIANSLKNFGMNKDWKDMFDNPISSYLESCGFKYPSVTSGSIWVEPYALDQIIETPEHIVNFIKNIKIHEKTY